MAYCSIALLLVMLFGGGAFMILGALSEEGAKRSNAGG